MVIPHSRPSIGQEDIRAVVDVLSSGMIAQGEKVKEFERAVAQSVGMRYGVAVSSGTAALHLALLGFGVGPRSEVIMPSYVCSSPYFAVLHAGGVPKVVDIDYADMNISATAVRRSIRSRTRAIIVPHMFGNPAELDDLVSLGVPVVEDCAQSLGAEYRKKKVGSVADVSVFSFYATKMITTGEGGMVATRERSLHEKIMSLRDYDKKALVPIKYNYKMTDFQATLGLSQLGRLEEFIETRRRIASFYDEELSSCGVQRPPRCSHKNPVFYRYVLTLDDMMKVQQRMRDSGVFCERPVWRPLHGLLRDTKCPNSDRAYQHALSIPLYPSLTQEEMEYVATRLQDVLKTLGKCTRQSQM
jgi:perosamine synthetase